MSGLVALLYCSRLSRYQLAFKVSKWDCQRFYNQICLENKGTWTGWSKDITIFTDCGTGSRGGSPITEGLTVQNRPHSSLSLCPCARNVPHIASCDLMSAGDLRTVIVLLTKSLKMHQGKRWSNQSVDIEKLFSVVRPITSANVSFCTLIFGVATFVVQYQCAPSLKTSAPTQLPLFTA